MMRVLSVVVVLLLFAAASAGQEQGKIVAIQTQEQNRFIPGYDNGQGAKSSGVTVRDRNQVYRVETADRFYLLEGGRKQELDLGATISFRLEKHRAIVRLGDKEKKFRVVGEELKQK